MYYKSYFLHFRPSLPEISSWISPVSWNIKYFDGILREKHENSWLIVGEYLILN